MNFLSTKQTAERWGITPKRVTVLAGQGRIAGAKQIAGRWFIPENAVKPADLRKQDQVSAPDESDPYLFPFPICMVTSEKQMDTFTPEQKELYRLCQFFENGSFPEARHLAEKLLTSENRYIRIGALYLLPVICMSLLDFSATDRYAILFYTICQEETAHRADIELLRIELEGEMGNYSRFVEEVHRLNINAYSRELLPFVCVYKLITLILEYRVKGICPDVSVYEVLCREYEEQGWFYNTVFFHFYLSLYYADIGDKESEHRHLRRALDIAIAHNIFFTFSVFLFYNPESVELIMQEYPAEYTGRIKKLAEDSFAARNAYTVYLGKKPLLEKLNEHDYELLGYCLNHRSNDQIAAGLGLTRSGVNKRLSSLYRKLEVESKKDLNKKVFDFLLEWK